MLVTAVQKYFRRLRVESLWYSLCELGRKAESLSHARRDYQFGTAEEKCLSRRIYQTRAKMERICKKLGMSDTCAHLPMQKTYSGMFPPVPEWLLRRHHAL